MTDRTRRKAMLTLLPTLILVVAGCTRTGGAAPDDPTADPSANPSGSPETTAAGVISHPSGATDVVLRLDETGGFVMATYAASRVPPFTLYGDGTIVIRDPRGDSPPLQGSVVVANPLRTATLSEAQVQDLLAFALGEGGLTTARREYPNDRVADAGTAVFTIRTDGLTKTVSVYALGLDGDGGPDDADRAALLKLADRLIAVGEDEALDDVVYEPLAYRATLIESPDVAVPDVQPWPWDGIAPSDFVQGTDPNGLQFPRRVMTPPEIEDLGVTGYEGGIQNLALAGPDGTTYLVAVRPLLRDESE
jgi:hypothetical protein